MRRARLAAAGFAALAAACASTGEPPPSAVATQDLLEVVAVVRLHVDDDTYRFPAARDYTGGNVFRASFERLERYETANPEKLASGYATDVVWFTKGRALERLGEYDLAMRHYARVAELDSTLAEPARVSQGVTQRLAAAHAMMPAPSDDADAAARVFAARRAALETLRGEVVGTHYTYVVEEELERGDELACADLAARAALDAHYDAAALECAQALVPRHRQSKNHNRHLLALGDLYAGLSRRYTEKFPPPSLGFDPATFDEYAHGATRVYEVVAQQDGSVEKIEAAHKLEAFLGFALRVHEERAPR